jgi:GntR family transcriptional repressor for pyruvate dehydrogenase complex
VPKEIVFDQVRRAPRLSDEVADRLRETILSQQLKPGDRLPSERELGEQFGVSRTVVREAVRTLVAKGLIDARSGSGLLVAAPAAASVSETVSLFILGSTLDYERVHEVRLMLELEMAARAAERRTEADVGRLTEACERMEAAVDVVDTAALADLEFHREIARAAHNELYLILHDAIGDALLDVRRGNLGVAGARNETLDHHRNILNAIVAADPEAARRAMRAHLEQVQSVWRARIEAADARN